MIPEEFTYISDVSDKIDELLEEAAKTRRKDVKHDLKERARELIRIFEEHIGFKVFNKVK